MSCLFCRIASGEIPADIVWQDDAVIAFRDIAPQAPTHILLITRDHHVTVGELATTAVALLPWPGPLPRAAFPTTGAEQGARVAEGRAKDQHLLQSIGAAHRRPGCCS